MRSGCVVCNFIWKKTPLSVKGGVGIALAITAVVSAILGSLHILPIPSYGQWALYLGGGVSAACSIMAIYFHCKSS